jgi:hypothetical protein
MLLLAGCYSGQRFTHVDIDGSPPYVFFDQKTQQICWGSADLDLYVAGQPVRVTVRPRNGDATQTKMPVCKDLK